MGGTTASGWPYVTPDDHPKEFPTHSQALANKLEATKVRGYQIRGADGGVAANTPAVVASVSVPGILGRRVLVIGEMRYTMTVAHQLFFNLANGPSIFRDVQLINQPIRTADEWITVQGVIDDCAYEAFTFQAQANAGSGTLTVRVGSAIHVIAI